MPSAKKKKNKAAFAVGLLLVIFAVVGIVSAVRWTGGTVKKLRDDTAEKREYEEFLKPVVMFDPDPFDDISSADIPQLVNAAIWSLITDEDSAGEFSYSAGETVGVLIPQEQVAAEFNRLFGREVDIVPLFQTIDMSAHDMTYDPAQNGFIIPITGLETAYVPLVREIERKGSSVVLTVDYIGNRAWAQVSGDGYSSPEPDKTMSITLREQDGGSYVASIQSLGVNDVAAVPVEPVTAVFQEPPVETAAAEGETGTGEESSDSTETTQEESESASGEENTSAAEDETSV